MRMELAVYSGLALGIVVSCRRTAENLCEWAELYEGRRRLLAYVLVDTGYTGIGIPSRDVVKCVTQLTKPKVKRSLKFCGLMLRTTVDRYFFFLFGTIHEGTLFFNTFVSSQG